LALGTDLRGKVVLLDLWSYTSLSCLDRLPFMRGMWARYGDLGFLPVGVHIPDYDFSIGPDMLGDAVKELGLAYPNISDDEKAIWAGLGRPAVPSRFLFDAKGVLRFSCIGPGGEQEMEAWVIRLLRERGSGLMMNGVVAPKRGNSPRNIEVVHCGALRGEGVGNDAEGEALKVCEFHDTTMHEIGQVYLDGEWMQELQYLEHCGQGSGHVAFRFEAAGLYAILSADAKAELELKLDGRTIKEAEAGKDISLRAGKSNLGVSKGRLVQILDGVPPGVHELTIEFNGPGQRIFSFTCVN